MSFLPLARSSATLEYYTAVTKDPISDGRTKVVAMDLGLKETLFNQYLLSDASFLGLAGILICVCILVFTQSFFLTLATVCAVVFALGLAYAVYSFVFLIDFFPFMNVLAVIIAVGKKLQTYSSFANSILQAVYSC